MEDANHESVRVPPGFRFHPTEEELLNYYLRKKVSYKRIDLDVIREVDLNKLEPWEIQEKCKIGSTPQNDWYFFSHKDKKYPTGIRTNRATAAGFWKATGRDKIIYASSKRIGMRKTLVFYTGRAPHGQKSDWIMHEYRLDDPKLDAILPSSASSSIADPALSQKDGWVVCRVFKKKNHHKSSSDQYSPRSSSVSSSSNMGRLHAAGRSSAGGGLGRGSGPLDEILQYMGRTCQQQRSNDQDTTASRRKMICSFSDGNKNMVITEDQMRFLQLPPLQSPSLPEDHYRLRLNQSSSSPQTCCYSSAPVPINGAQTNVDDLGQQYESGTHMDGAVAGASTCAETATMISGWAALDRFLASHLNGGQGEASKLMACFSEPPNAASFVSSISDLDEDQHPLRPNLHPQSHTTFSEFYEKEPDIWSFPNS